MGTVTEVFRRSMDRASGFNTSKAVDAIVLVI